MCVYDSKLSARGVPGCLLMCARTLNHMKMRYTSHCYSCWMCRVLAAWTILTRSSTRRLPPLPHPCASCTGPAGKLTISTGSCSLTRSANPLKLEYKLDCTEPGVSFESRVPRYTSR